MLAWSAAVLQEILELLPCAPQLAKDWTCCTMHTHCKVRVISKNRDAEIVDKHAHARAQYLDASIILHGRKRCSTPTCTHWYQDGALPSRRVAQCVYGWAPSTSSVPRTRMLSYSALEHATATWCDHHCDVSLMIPKDYRSADMMEPRHPSFCSSSSWEPYLCLQAHRKALILIMLAKGEGFHVIRASVRVATDSHRNSVDFKCNVLRLLQLFATRKKALCSLVNTRKDSRNTIADMRKCHVLSIAALCAVHIKNHVLIRCRPTDLHCNIIELLLLAQPVFNTQHEHCVITRVHCGWSGLLLWILRMGAKWTGGR